MIRFKKNTNQEALCGLLYNVLLRAVEEVDRKENRKMSNYDVIPDFYNKNTRNNNNINDMLKFLTEIG